MRALLDLEMAMRELELCPPRRRNNGRPERAFEASTTRGKDHFVIEVRAPLVGTVIVPAGHEVLTRRAAGSLFTAAEIDALVAGVRRVDDVPIQQHFQEASQRRHALRRTRCTPIRTALSEIRNHLLRLHNTALATRPRPEAMGWLGEALHLLQDSYSEAHVDRIINASAPHPIQFIRFFGMTGFSAPLEHRVRPSLADRTADPRDIITDSGGALTPAATRALRASEEYLAMARRHLASPTDPVNAAELRRFMDRHLLLSSSPLDPGAFYSDCPRPAVPSVSPPPTPPTPTTPPATPPSVVLPPTIRRGARGLTVRNLQTRLNAVFAARPTIFRQICQRPHACVMPLVVDGNFGPRTEAAVRTYQLQRRLSPDGVVGPITWSVLLAETSGP